MPSSNASGENSAPANESRSASSAGPRAGEPSGEGAASQPATRLDPGLYIVATPIGNLGDVTLRALETLRSVDAIACEDTRVTAKLLSAYGITRPTLSYHDHNAARRRPEIVRRIQAGEAVALVSDAGTPLVSDPGYKLVRSLHEEGLHVSALPGASAALTALVLSGLPSDRFFFQGFLPSKRKARRDALAEVAGLQATLVFYESAQRLASSLADMAAVLGPREAVVARELTKRFEELRRGRLDTLAESYDQPPRGEIVVVVAPPAPVEAPAEEELDARIEEALTQMSLRDAVGAVSAETGVAKKTVYARALALKEGPE